MTPDAQWQQLADQFIAQHDAIEMGKMMSAPAIQYKGKVFAFFYEGKMTFKLGKGYDIHSLGIHDYEHLAPFKSKPPMKAWFIVADAAHWQALANAALGNIKCEVDK